MRYSILITLTIGLLYAPPAGWDQYQIFPDIIDQKFPEMENLQTKILMSFNKESELFIRIGSDYGFRWSNSVKISAAASHNAVVVENNQSIAAKPDQVPDTRLFAVWTEYNQSQDEYSLWFSYSTDPEGLIWSSPQRIDNLIGAANAVEPFYPDIFYHWDTLRLAFYYAHPGGKEIGYSHYSFFGGEWSSYETVATGPDLYPVAQVVSALRPPTEAHIIYAYGSAVSCSLMHAMRVGPNNWEKNLVYLSNNGLLEPSEFCKSTSENQYLHLAFQQLRDLPEYPKTGYTYTSDLGQTWSQPDFFGPKFASSRHSDITVRDDLVDSVRLIYEWGSDALAYRERGETQGDWSNRLIIVENVPASYPTVSFYRPNTYIAFQTTADQNQIAYLAHHGYPHSGTSEATYPNSSRHLLREPGTEHLYVVYQTIFCPDQTQQHDRHWIYFLFSPDGSVSNNWEPLTWLNYGCNPAISMHEYVGPSGPMHFITYLSEDEKQIYYRWFDPDNQVWSDPLVIYDNPSDNDLDAPAITAVGDTVFVLFAENSATESWIKYVWFRFDETNPNNVNIDLVTPLPGTNRHSPSVYHDGNGDLHAVWKEGDDVWYAWREWGQKDWDRYQNVSEPPSNYASKPFIEVWGDMAYVVWEEHLATGYDDIYRRRKDIPNNHWYPIETGISSSQYYYSLDPTAAENFVMWSEYTDPGRFQIYCYHTYLQPYPAPFTPGPYSGDPFFPHSSARPDYFGIYLYGIWGEGGPPKCCIISYRRYFSIMGGAEWYAVETGNSDPSPFLIQRQGIKDYGSHKIDYDSKELIYELSFLDPRYDYYLVAGSYHEGAPRKEVWFIDGEEVGEFKFLPNRPETVMVQIPYETYVKDRKVKVIFKNASGSFAAKAGMVLTCVDHRQQGGGGQSGGKESQVASKFRIGPNPTRGRLTFDLTLSRSSPVKVDLYDLSGRKVANLLNRRLAAGSQSQTLTLPDKIASGIYFLMIEVEGKKVSEKVVLRH